MILITLRSLHYCWGRGRRVTANCVLANVSEVCKKLPEPWDTHLVYFWLMAAAFRRVLCNSRGVWFLLIDRVGCLKMRIQVNPFSRKGEKDMQLQELKEDMNRREKRKNICIFISVCWLNWLPPSEDTVGMLSPFNKSPPTFPLGISMSRIQCLVSVSQKKKYAYTCVVKYPCLKKRKCENGTVTGEWLPVPRRK